MLRLLVVTVLAFGAFVPLAWAAPPPNDDRGNASAISLPATVRGTTVDSTLEPGEPFSCAGPLGGSVWYSVAGASAARDLVLELDASGDLDAAVDVFRRDRSQLTSVTCGTTNRRGRLTLDFTQARGAALLIRVASRENSANDAFALRVVEPDQPERPPGRALGASASGSVDRIANPDDAYGVTMHAGTTYRVHLVSRKRCVNAALFPPGTTSFPGGDPVRSFGCDKYFLYTPGPGSGGRYSIQVRAPRSVRGALPYHLAVARAGEDDTGPGLVLANDVRVRGSLRGAGADVVDLYRFSVSRRSILDLRLATGGSNPFDLQLVGAAGRRIACSCGDFGSQALRLKLAPGRYYAAVRARSGANGAYRLSRLTRTITKTRAVVDGKRFVEVTPGSTVDIGVRVTPGVDGPVTVDVERFDPLAGWQFYTRYRRTVSGGSASIPFTPPSVGRWRVRATYDGTRRAAPSGPGRAAFTVAEPLQE
jgi:hypothetical protein